MSNENLLVLICKDYEHSTEIKGEVLDVPIATERLEKERLALTIAGDTWQIENKGNSPFSFTARIGESCGFGVNNYPLMAPTYFVGVYDRTKTEQMQKMADSIIFKESRRHPGFDDGD